MVHLGVSQTWNPQVMADLLLQMVYKWMICGYSYGLRDHHLDAFGAKLIVARTLSLP